MQDNSTLPTRLPAPVVSASQLAERLDSGCGLTLLDVRWELGTGAAKSEFDTGHIPGAAFVDLDRQLAGPPGPRGRHPLPSAEDFAAAMRAAGVWERRPVVVYDGRTSLSAARAWWLLRYFGHQAAAVLDGGLAAWVLAGGALASGAPPPPACGDFQARPGGMPVLDAAGAADLARRGGLLDARAPERFRGETEPIDPVAGHIPGALNVPMAQTIEPDGRLRSPALASFPVDADLVTRLDGAPMVGVYCGSGITAAHQVLALELAGVRAALYPGSWSEWISDPDRPVATGP